jgi:hypothetical protein
VSRPDPTFGGARAADASVLGVPGEATPTIYRISAGGKEPIVDVASLDAIEPSVRSGKPGRYHIDGVASDPLPSGHTSRRWGTAIKHPDGTVAVEPDPWEP